MKFKSKTQSVFNVESVTSGKMESAISRWGRTYEGTPDWLGEDDDFRTINFAKALCSETARLATLGIGVKIEGDARAKWLQEQIENIYYRLRNWVEYACAYGTIILKPNGDSVDLVLPSDFIVTEAMDGAIKGIVFINRKTSANQKKFYTRLEYHRYEDDGKYVITNKCYVGKAKDDMDEEISIEESPWKDLSEEESIENTKPLYGVLRMPNANNIDIESPLGMSIFSEAMAELRDLDIAYTINNLEIEDSKKIVLLDSDRLVNGAKLSEVDGAFARQKEALKLPRFIKNVYGDGNTSFYQEINPTLNTTIRVEGINTLLSQIGYKVGYANGYFVFNEASGIQTATGVDANEQRTIQFIKDIRDKIEDALTGLIDALNSFADLYDFAPVGKYETHYDFGDITYNYQEDKMTWWGYVLQNRVAFWRYLVKFENMTEEEAKEIEAEMTPQQAQLFGGE